MKNSLLLSLLLLGGCTSGHKPAPEKAASAAHSEEPVRIPFRQIDLTHGQEFPEKASYKDLRFTVNYDSENGFLRIADSRRTKDFSLSDFSTGIGTGLVLLDNGDVQLLCLECEYEHMVSVHFYVIRPEGIRESVVADVEIWSDDYTGLKYEGVSMEESAVVRISGGVEVEDVRIRF